MNHKTKKVIKTKKNKIKSIIIILSFFIIIINNLNISPQISNITQQSSTRLNQKSTPVNSAIIDPVDLYGLIIGVFDYFGSYDDRPFADTDAEAFYSILINDYGCDPEKIYLLINQNATKENILSSFDNISSSIDNNDKFILYFAGNGFVDDPLNQNFTENIQTPHNYGSYENLYWNITHENVSAIRLHFTRFETEFNVDTLYLGTSEDVSAIDFEKTYSGLKGYDFWTDFIPTSNNSIHLRFVSSLSNHFYGFEIDKYQIINGSSNSQGIVPYGYYQQNTEFINASALKQKFNELNCSKKFAFFDSDFSGGILSEIYDNNTFALSSTSKTEYNNIDFDLNSGIFSRFLFESFSSIQVDTNEDFFNSFSEIFDYINDSIILRSEQLNKVIHPQKIGDNISHIFTFPAIFLTNFSKLNFNLNYSFFIDGLSSVQQANLLIYSQSDNSYENISLIPSSVSESGFGKYSGQFNHNKTITSVGITASILLNNSEIFHLSSYEDSDIDMDNLTDIFEIILGINPALNDTDSDDLLDYIELIIGTNPSSSDTDNDGMNDGWEYYYSLNPKNAEDNITDLDEDGLLNIFEFLNQTSPINPDTDGDSIDDAWEVNFHLNPLDPSDNETDPDGDNFSSIIEYQNYIQTDPFDADCDDDLINDYWEFHNLTDPWSNDTDSDGLSDSEEILTFKTSPINFDTDSDQLSDWVEIHTYFTNPLLNDTDFDGLWDGQEVYIGTNASNPDTDGDGIDDFEEVYEGNDGYITNPNNRDTDGDGQDDLFEIRNGSDPTDPNSKSELWWQLPLIFGSIGGFIGISFIYKKSKIWRFNRTLKLAKKNHKKIDLKK